MEGSLLINIQVHKSHYSCMLKLSLVHLGDLDHEGLSVERSLLLNVETEPFFFSLPHELPMCNFTLPDIFHFHAVFGKNYATF